MTFQPSPESTPGVKLPPDKGIAYMRHVFDQLSSPPRGRGAGPNGDPVIAVTNVLPAGGADTVITTVMGGPGPGATVSDGGGRKMTSAKLYVVFWGDAWKSAASPSMNDVLN